MIHARPDYQERIVDTAGLIPEDEPVFLLRGQDKAAPEVLDFWADLNSKHGGDFQLSQKARFHANAMRQWQIEHGGGKSADWPKEKA